MHEGASKLPAKVSPEGACARAEVASNATKKEPSGSLRAPGSLLPQQAWRRQALRLRVA